MMRFFVGLLLVAALASARHYDPSSRAVAASDVQYFLYTRGSPDVGQEMIIGNLQGADFDGSRPTKFIVHSRGEKGDTQWVTDMKLRYLVAYDANVVVVDWRGPADGLYGNVVDRSFEVGNYLGSMMGFLRAQAGGDFTNFHCVGFGIGGHVCGFGGKKHPTNKLGRITGLDPNRENFNINDPTTRLADTDANFVDVIHTCGTDIGLGKPFGHADFFPNNGGEDPSMPGCGAVINGDCSHNRAHEYFTESINSVGFHSLQCTSWSDFKNGACNANEAQPMGEQCATSARGDFYLHTNDKSPYAQG